MSLTRNPGTSGNTLPTNSATCSAAPLRRWKPSVFSATNESWNTTKNRGVRRITRFDVLDLQHRLPRWMLQLPYDLLNRLNRRRLLRDNDS